ncbi:MAG: ABC transporter ATP-binding protein [Variovorax sp.]
MLQVKSISRAFSGVKALDAVDFTVKAGSVTSLIGPNGAGKTTLINVVSGVVQPDSGDVLFGGQSLLKHRRNQRAAMGIRRTFQTVHLFAGMTVRENLTVGRFHGMLHGNWLQALLPQKTGDADGNRLAEATLDLLGLGALADTLATKLPYGTQRRVEIARALMGRPRFLLLDEPAAGMNDSETEELRDDIRRIRDSGVTVFLVEHDMALVMSVSDHVVVFDFGKKIAEGTPAEVQRNPAVIASYLA